MVMLSTLRRVVKPMLAVPARGVVYASRDYSASRTWWYYYYVVWGSTLALIAYKMINYELTKRPDYRHIESDLYVPECIDKRDPKFDLAKYSQFRAMEHEVLKMNEVPIEGKQYVNFEDSAGYKYCYAFGTTAIQEPDLLEQKIEQLTESLDEWPVEARGY